MPYISPDGRIGGRSGWSLATIPNLFWGFINFIILFFQTLVNPDAASQGSRRQTSSYGSPGRRPPPGPPPRRMGRINHGGGPSPPPMMGGG